VIICGAQLDPIAGSIEVNIDRHIQLIELAQRHRVEAIFFPELSITGYAPKYAKKVAAQLDPEKLFPLRQLSIKNKMIIGVGIPVNHKQGVSISQLFFMPSGNSSIYHKTFLHEDELPYFIGPANDTVSISLNLPVALAICHEITVPEHSHLVKNSKANLFVACAAKTGAGMAKAKKRMSFLAMDYGMPSMLVNCIGEAEDVRFGGNTSSWDNRGNRTGLLPVDASGILIIDSLSDRVTTHLL